jgi:uncharacterized iron-regulated membrane protein
MMTMVFALLCFTGVFVMFFHVARSLEKFQEHMRNEHAQLKVQLRALEARLESLAGTQAVVSAPLPDDALAAPLALSPQDPLDAALDDPLVSFEPRR